MFCATATPRSVSRFTNTVFQGNAIHFVRSIKHLCFQNVEFWVPFKGRTYQIIHFLWKFHFLYKGPYLVK